ncbi:MAG: hypothetical protein ABIJ97_08895 [Bacteroidota bacterium]
MRLELKSNQLKLFERIERLENEVAKLKAEMSTNKRGGYYKLGIEDTANSNNILLSYKTIAIPELVKEMYHD